MGLRYFFTSRPCKWVLPRQPVDISLRGPILPMREPTLLERLLRR